MRVKVTTKHGLGRIYMGNKLPEDEQEGTEALIVKAVAGELTSLSFIVDTGGRVYIPAKVLETSVIELVD